MAATKDFLIKQGKTFAVTLRWEAPPIVYKAITAIEASAPVRITAAAHGVPEGWRVAVVGVKGMTEVNAEANSIREVDYHAASVLDVNTVEINDINAASFKPYVSGGHIQFNTPVDMAGYTARLVIRDRVGGTALDTLTDSDGINIDNVGKKIVITISAADTALFTWRKGYYELEMESGAGVVTQLLSGAMQVQPEIAT